MKKNKEKEHVEDDGTYVVKKNHKRNVIALILCAIIAFFLWVYVMNVEAGKPEEPREFLSVQRMPGYYGETYV